MVVGLGSRKRARLMASLSPHVSTAAMAAVRGALYVITVSPAREPPRPPQTHTHTLFIIHPGTQPFSYLKPVACLTAASISCTHVLRDVYVVCLYNVPCYAVIRIEVLVTSHFPNMYTRLYSSNSQARLDMVVMMQVQLHLAAVVQMAMATCGMGSMSWQQLWLRGVRMRCTRWCAG